MPSNQILLSHQAYLSSCVFVLAEGRRWPSERPWSRLSHWSGSPARFHTLHSHTTASEWGNKEMLEASLLFYIPLEVGSTPSSRVGVELSFEIWRAPSFPCFTALKWELVSCSLLCTSWALTLIECSKRKPATRWVEWCWRSLLTWGGRDCRKAQSSRSLF